MSEFTPVKTAWQEAQARAFHELNRKARSAERSHRPGLIESVDKLGEIHRLTITGTNVIAQQPGLSARQVGEVEHFLNRDPFVLAHLRRAGDQSVRLYEAAKAISLEFAELLERKGHGLSTAQECYARRILIADLWQNACLLQASPAQLVKPTLLSSWVAGLVLVQGERSTQALCQLLNPAPKLPGAVLLALNGNQVMEQRSYGLANLKTGESLNCDTPLDLASLGKALTALAIFKLFQAGRLSPDTLISPFLPGWTKFGSVTVDHLIRHSSGIPEYCDLLQHAVAPPKNREAIALLSQHGTSVFAPGTQTQYSNSNYIGLAQIIEHISGLPFGSYLRREIFDPCGMTNTYVWDGSAKAPQSQAVGYTLEQGMPRDYQFPAYTVGDGGIYSSIRDLAKFFAALLDGKLVAPEKLPAIFSPGTLNNGKQLPYGYGWFLGQHQGLDYAFHTGLWEGLGVDTVIPCLKFSTVFLANNQGYLGQRRTIARAVNLAWTRQDLGAMQDF